MAPLLRNTAEALSLSDASAVPVIQIRYQPSASSRMPARMPDGPLMAVPATRSKAQSATPPLKLTMPLPRRRLPAERSAALTCALRVYVTPAVNANDREQWCAPVSVVSTSFSAVTDSSGAVVALAVIVTRVANQGKVFRLAL